MLPFNHSQTLQTLRLPDLQTICRALSSVYIAMWLGGCAAPVEKDVGDTSLSTPNTDTEVPVATQSAVAQAATSGRQTSRLIPPQQSAATPTVSNELIVADNVINQGIPSPLETATGEDAMPTLAAATADTQPTPETDEDQAAEQLEQLTLLAISGDVDAQLALAEAYASSGPTTDKTEAHYWYHLAAEQGNQVAQYKLGLQYYHGDGVDTDYTLAREWWLESATRGSADAQQKLGYLYSEALGVERDYNRAILWYTRAAQLGHAEAQTLLGSLYHEGNRVPQNYAEAFKWYKMAAERGHPHSQYTLATLYHDGFGTEQDFVKCTAWVDVALANGYIDEFNAREECSKHLTDEQLDRAAVLANRWKPNYLDKPEFN